MNPSTPTAVRGGTGSEKNYKLSMTSASPRIAILQFPGFNCEYETRRIVRAAGMNAEFFRWNDDPKKLRDYDGFVLPGGFSYEDRGRAGLIASLDSAMDELMRQAEAGKPLLGICNGAQVLIETGLIPGKKNNPGEGAPYNLLMSLARNKRIQDGRILGTGFYNAWVHMKSSAPQGRTPFNFRIPKDQVWRIPVAHGEGRFTTQNPTLPQELQKNEQIIFQYCDEAGNVSDEFPTNPNGALFSMAALSNPLGNVMGIMPHPERGFTAPVEAIFESLKDWFGHQRKIGTANFSPCSPVPPSYSLTSSSPSIGPSDTYTHPAHSLEFLIELIITDNEAESLQSALRRKGFEGVELKRYVHYEVEHRDVKDLDAFIEEIKTSGELFNPNKEEVAIIGDEDERPLFTRISSHIPNTNSKILNTTFAILVRDRDDFAGQGKAQNLRRHLHEEKHIVNVKRGTLWVVTQTAEKTFNQILSTNIFYNPHAQTVLWY